MTYKLLIFDLDGTLVDTREDIAAAINFSLKTLGFKEKSVELITTYIGAGLSATMHKALDGAHQEKLLQATQLFKEYYVEHPVEKASLYLGIEDLLRSSRGMRKAVVSNKDKELCDKTLTLLGVREYFDMIIGGDDPRCRKPDAYPLIKVMDTFAAGTEETMIIGDMDSDIAAGKKACIKTCGVTYGFGSVSSIQQAKPDFIIHTIDELKNILRA